MILSLFRMIELCGGSIIIDGIDISTLPREEIRTKLIGVPQDAFLLDGSVRLNADPSNTVAEGPIVSALKSVQLWDIINEKGGLDIPVEKLFLSHGQKQLFCLARAMLRPSSILVLDEATSRLVFLTYRLSSKLQDTDISFSVDANTEKLMQHVIREKFANHTIIAVAHRLETILDFDKIAVLDAGELLEFDNPHKLLAKPSALGRLYNSLMAEQIEVVPPKREALSKKSSSSVSADVSTAASAFDSKSGSGSASASGSSATALVKNKKKSEGVKK